MSLSNQLQHLSGNPAIIVDHYIYRKIVEENKIDDSKWDWRKNSATVKHLYLTFDQEKGELGQTIREVLSFDYYYEMSDSHDVWKKGESAKRDLNRKLLNLTPADLVYLHDMVKGFFGDEKFESYFKRYF